SHLLLGLKRKLFRRRFDFGDRAHTRQTGWIRAHSQARGWCRPPTLGLAHSRQENRSGDMDADLSKNANEDESPDWHAEILRQTEEYLKAGKIASIAWEEAKKELRKRFS